MKTLNYQDVMNYVSLGDSTAFVYGQNKSYNYSMGEIAEVLYNTNAQKFNLYGYSDAPIEVREAIEANFLEEMKPADGVVDEGYEDLVDRLRNGEAEILEWKNGEKTNYMLVLSRATKRPS